MAFIKNIKQIILYILIPLININIIFSSLEEIELVTLNDSSFWKLSEKEKTIIILSNSTFFESLDNENHKRPYLFYKNIINKFFNKKMFSYLFGFFLKEKSLAVFFISFMIHLINILLYFFNCMFIVFCFGIVILYYKSHYMSHPTIILNTNFRIYNNYSLSMYNFIGITLFITIIKGGFGIGSQYDKCILNSFNSVGYPYILTIFISLSILLYTLTTYISPILCALCLFGFVIPHKNSKKNKHYIILFVLNIIILISMATRISDINFILENKNEFKYIEEKIKEFFRKSSLSYEILYIDFTYIRVTKFLCFISFFVGIGSIPNLIYIIVRIYIKPKVTEISLVEKPWNEIIEKPLMVEGVRQEEDIKNQIIDYGVSNQYIDNLEESYPVGVTCKYDVGEKTTEDICFNDNDNDLGCTYNIKYPLSNKYKILQNTDYEKIISNNS